MRYHLLFQLTSQTTFATDVDSPDRALAFMAEQEGTITVTERSGVRVDVLDRRAVAMLTVTKLPAGVEEGPS